MDIGPERAPAPRRANLTLAACVAIGVAAFVGSDALATRSEVFWRLAEAGTRGSEDAGLALEVQAHRLAEGPRLAALVMGSSVAESNYSLRTLGRGLGAEPERVGRLWMPGMSGLELGMLGPTLRRLRPERVFVPAMPLLMMDELRWDRTRVYSPRVALRLFPARELFADRAEHGSRALAAGHIVVRRRSELRRALLGSRRDLTAMPPPAESPGVAGQVHALRRARETDFRCQTIHLRALRLFAEEVRDAGSTLVLSVAPVGAGSVASSETVAARLDECLRALDLPATQLRLRDTRPAFGDGDFRDLMHLNRSAAERFTRWSAGEPVDAL